MGLVTDAPPAAAAVTLFLREFTIFFLLLLFQNFLCAVHSVRTLDSVLVVLTEEEGNLISTRNGWEGSTFLFGTMMSRE